MNEWTDPNYAATYLSRMNEMPHRVEGEATLLSEVPADSRRILDLGCGDGHLLSLVLDHCVNATGVGLEFSDPMLNQAQRRFENDSRVSLVEHNLDSALPDLGTFDCVVSSFAIHHCTDHRKRDLYADVFDLLEPGGIFCNLEHVSSPSGQIHDRFVAAMNMTPADEDPSNKLLDVVTQLRWFRELGFEEVDCYWKWRELALLIGFRPAVTAGRNAIVETAAHLTIDESPSAMEVSWFDDQLGVFNKQQTHRDDFEPINLVIREKGAVIAGMKAVTGWDWLYVQVLWVEEKHRHAGHGTRLLERVEQMARERGCLGSCLSSYSFQAPEFYKRHGYAAFGQIDDYPAGQTMFFMSKSL